MSAQNPQTHHRPPWDSSLKLSSLAHAIYEELEQSDSRRGCAAGLMAWLRVRLAVPREEQVELFHRLRTLSEGLPIAAQLDWDMAEADDASQPPSGPADRTVLTLHFILQVHSASPGSSFSYGILTQWMLLVMATVFILSPYLLHRIARLPFAPVQGGGVEKCVLRMTASK